VFPWLVLLKTSKVHHSFQIAICRHTIWRRTYLYNLAAPDTFHVEFNTTRGLVKVMSVRGPSNLFFGNICRTVQTLQYTRQLVIPAMFQLILCLFGLCAAWAPLGVDRFYTLLKQNYYDDNAFFRVIQSPRPFVAQWGISSTPSIAQKWLRTRRRIPLSTIINHFKM
jgi:hypothetical protein